jgi:hypothetical protein
VFHSRLGLVAVWGALMIAGVLPVAVSGCSSHAAEQGLPGSASDAGTRGAVSDSSASDADQPDAGAADASLPDSPGTTNSGDGGPGWAGIVAPSRAIDWNKAGLPAAFPDGETTPNPWTPPVRPACTSAQAGMTVPVAAGTSMSAIGTALSSCSTANPKGSYLLLGPGTFTLSANTNFYSGNVTLRGSGPMQTIVQVTGSAQLSIGAASGAGSAPLTAATQNYTRGATSVVVTTSSPPTVGNVAWLNQCDTGFSGNPCTGTHVDNGGLYVCGLDTVCDSEGSNNPTSYTPAFQQQTVLVTSVTNSGGGTYTIGFTPGLYMPNWDYARTPTLNWQTQSYIAVGEGIEDMTFVFSSGQSEEVDIGSAYGCWIKGVRFIGTPVNRAVNVSRSKNSLVTNNYFFGSASSSAINLAIQQGSDSDDLLLNNITDGMVLNDATGSDEGVVIAYNFSRDVIISYYQPPNFQHQAGSAFVLNEGNEVGGILDDDTWGTHDLNTFFRNDVFCSDPPFDIAGVYGQGILMGPFARFDNAIGNAIGGSKCTTYQSTASNYVSNYIFSFGAGNDPLGLDTSMRWGNYDTVTGAVRWCGDSSDPGWSTTCGSISEVPSSLASPNASLSNPVPSDMTLPASFFMDVSAHPSGGTGLSWWKVCKSWTTFPTTCAAADPPPFPAAGPDVTGGPNMNGHAYDIPAALAYTYLPIDPAYQGSYDITSSSWSNGTETLTVTGLPSGSIHIMGGFQVTGAPACNSPAGGELEMTGSTATTIGYALASNPGSCAGGTVKFPDVRQFDERVYESDP